MIFSFFPIYKFDDFMQNPFFSLLKIILISAFFFITKVNATPHYSIASAHPLATQAGIQILQQGGNAFDAAVTVSAVLAVVEPYSSGIGGGGFWLLYQAKNQNTWMLDGREVAPLRATAKMYLDEKEQVIPHLSINGALAAGIPGEPAALVALAKQGNLPLSTSLAPAIRLAKAGFKVDAFYQKMAGFRLQAMQQYPATAKIFLKQNQIPPLNTLIKQPDLAHTLELLAKKGKAGFYQGEIAQKLVQSVQQAGGIWTLADLAQYQVKIRQPIQSTYKDMRIISAALPSSGGIVLSQALQILENFDLTEQDPATRIHLIVEALRRAYRDRAEYMGDSDFISVPVKKLIASDYADGLAQSIRRDKATPSLNLAPTFHSESKGTDTTHFSILDQEGNRVAATLSINYPFGSTFVAEGTGVLLNDEMDDFSAKPNTPNIYGLVGSFANAIAPKKRMLSSMTPTFLETKDRIALLGTPGGSRIISMVLLGSLAFYENKSAEEIVNLARFHHQYLPDRIEYEKKTLDLETRKTLQKKGHTLVENEPWGNMQLIIKNKKTGMISSASDQRGIGQSADF